MTTTRTTATTAAEAQETEATGHYVTTQLAGKDVETVPGGAWRQSTMRKLRAGDIDGFMEDVLSPDSYELFLELDPTNDEVGEFANAAGEAAGEQMGKSSGPSASSKRTPRR
ncbi:hypothetical protein PUR59_00660 [Streptomyces sp. SP18ES09]|uniref:hypothetical protein n=1 Tax=Streptomyces sp. SP18ES09 TaxID=3002532 RepID=UPI002E7AA0CA|nr:hypothetical protein [Streptomyces sp. SP18ES09]MEE1813563.1 hypothetical protein [Streptomyces sp. SP18ES09]